MNLPVEQLAGLDVIAIEEALIVETPLCIDAEGNLLPTDILHNTLTVLKVLEKLSKTFRKELTKEILDKGDQKIEGTPRSWFTIKKREGREEISALLAGPILRDAFTLEECDQFLKIDKGKLLKAAEARAPRGEKKKASTALMESLHEAGAVMKGDPTYTLDVVRKEVTA